MILFMVRCLDRTTGKGVGGGGDGGKWGGEWVLKGAGAIGTLIAMATPSASRFGACILVQGKGGDEGSDGLLEALLGED